MSYTRREGSGLPRGWVHRPNHAKSLWRQFWSYGKPKSKNYEGRHRNDSGVNRSHGDRFGDWG